MKRVLEAIWIPADRSAASRAGGKALEMRWLIEIVSDRPCGIDLQAIDIAAATDALETCPEPTPIFRRVHREFGLRERLLRFYPSMKEPQE